MYYRRKILLAVMQQFGGSLTRTDLQKLLFLFSKKQSEPSYHFIPYKYGCFSYQANQDVSTLIKYNQIEESNSLWNVVDKEKYINQLKMSDRIDLVRFYNTFKGIKGDKLVKYVYENYPYYAINSEIARELLDESHYQKVQEFIPQNNDYTLFTIGYEGKTVEEYVNQLILRNVKALCDVRKNSISMKYGFSKNQLKNIVENVGIRYFHFPELGIDTEKRQNLNSFQDYQLIFDDYEKNTLPKSTKELDLLYELFLTHKRIALTCFEADYKCCHRSRTANALVSKFSENYSVEHI